MPSPTAATLWLGGRDHRSPRARPDDLMRLLGISGSLGVARTTPRCSTPPRPRPTGVELVVWPGSTTSLPTTRTPTARRRQASRRAAGRNRSGRRRPDRHAGIRRVDPRSAQERARLGLAAVPGERPPGQAGRRRRRQHRNFGAIWAQAELRKVLRTMGAASSIQGCRSPGRTSASHPEGRLREHVIALALQQIVACSSGAPSRRAT